MRVSALEPGDEVGLLTLVRPVGRDSRSVVLWECACRCGATTHVRGNHLASAQVVSCGCAVAPEDLTGRRFGALLVLRMVRRERAGRPTGVVLWACRCDCGAETETTGYHLHTADTPRCHQCACDAAGARRALDLTGLRRGSLVAVCRVRGHATHEHQATWLAACDCGRQRIVWAARFRRGGIRRCARDCPAAVRAATGVAKGTG